MTTTVLNTKIVKKILDTNSLVTTTIINAKLSEVENKIPDHVKYITTHEFNKLSAEAFAARLKQTNLVGKSTDFNNKVTSFNKKLPQIRQKLKFRISK